MRSEARNPSQSPRRIRRSKVTKWPRSRRPALQRGLRRAPRRRAGGALDRETKTGRDGARANVATADPGRGQRTAGSAPGRGTESNGAGAVTAPRNLQATRRLNETTTKKRRDSSRRRGPKVLLRRALTRRPKTWTFPIRHDVPFGHLQIKTFRDPITGLLLLIFMYSA
jgi:hypothetical protein